MTTTLRDRIVVNRFSAMTALAAAVLVLTVPQLAALLPMHWPLSRVEWLLAAFVVGLTIVYALLWFSAVPVRDLPEEHHFGEASRIERLHTWLDDHVGAYVDRTLEWLCQHPYFAPAMLLASVSMLWFDWVPPFAINLAILSAWLLAQRWSRAVLLSWLFETPEARIAAARKLVGRTITLVLLTNAAGELLWALVGAQPYPTGYRAYSSWAVVQTLFAGLLAVRAFDGLAMLGLPWIRTKAFLAILFIAYVTPDGETIGLPRLESPGPAHAGLPSVRSKAPPLGARPDWLTEFEQQLREVPRDEPVVFVAASGGGSRAAIVASLTYETLASLEAKKGSSRTLVNNIVLISSVSGGSLATAYFVSGGVEASRELLDRARQPGAFATEMATDFMAPLLRGVLTLNVERGTSVSHFWRDRYRWQKLTDDEAPAHGRPLVIFNAIGQLHPATSQSDSRPSTNRSRHLGKLAT